MSSTLTAYAPGVTNMVHLDRAHLRDYAWLASQEDSGKLRAASDVAACHTLLESSYTDTGLLACSVENLPERAWTMLVESPFLLHATEGRVTVSLTSTRDELTHLALLSSDKNLSAALAANSPYLAIADQLGTTSIPAVRRVMRNLVSGDLASTELDEKARTVFADATMYVLLEGGAAHLSREVEREAGSDIAEILRCTGEAVAQIVATRSRSWLVELDKGALGYMDLLHRQFPLTMRS